MAASDYVCDWEGCVRTAEDDAMIQVSPKGGPFLGMCPPHYRQMLDGLERDGSSDG